MERCRPPTYRPLANPQCLPAPNRFRKLHRERPRDLFLRSSLIAVGLLVLYSLIAGDFSLGDLYSNKFSSFWEDLTSKDEPGSGATGNSRGHQQPRV